MAILVPQIMGHCEGDGADCGNTVLHIMEDNVKVMEQIVAI